MHRVKRRICAVETEISAELASELFGSQERVESKPLYGGFAPAGVAALLLVPNAVRLWTSDRFKSRFGMECFLDRYVSRTDFGNIWCPGEG